MAAACLFAYMYTITVVIICLALSVIASIGVLRDTKT